MPASWARLAPGWPRLRGGPPPVPPWDNEDLLREELFSIERLEQHAASLARAQALADHPVRRPPLSVRLGENEALLLEAYRGIGRVVAAGRTATPAAEWLLDNFHLVEAQIREIREDLPPGFYRELPKLADGPLAGYPRVLGIAWAFVAHTDSHFDPEALRRFVRAYQAVQPLTIGELWAVAITLRIVLVENLRRAAQGMVSSRVARQQADDLADRLLGVNGQALAPEALAAWEDHGPGLPRAFVVQLVQRLRDQDPRVTPALEWLEGRLAGEGTSSEALVRAELQRQGGSNVTVRNIITSMRLISELEWSEFFESVSLVDEALRAASDFGALDFATRNLYRRAIEDLSRGSGRGELAITGAVLAAAAAGQGRQRDPGYHLLGSGRAACEARVGYRAPFRRRPGRWFRRRGVGPYVGFILGLAAGLLVLALQALDGPALAGWQLALLAVLGVGPAMDLAVAVVNRLATGSFGATFLPGLALREGVPAELRTLVAVPMLLTTAETISEALERLEIHYLASPPGALHFALLSDWVDYPTAQAPTDAALLALAAEGIAGLNLRHPARNPEARFLLLHRQRVWSDSQGQWMGWERKRGKLHELNRLLRGATDTSFCPTGAGPVSAPSGVRFVITLDADTRLPRDTVRRLIGKLAHPLNQPRTDAAAGRVVEGYAVLQPRVTPSLPMGREGSLFQRVVSSAPGLDPYAGAVSDVYQDLFGEGSYTGKGIYDVDAFEAALAGRVGEGALLSHDLFEGIFARAGLASDVEVVEEFPARYDVAAARQHRWARGDWQLLPWLLGRRDARVQGGGQLPAVGRWKMLDNLRRTLSAPAAFLALVAGWTLPLADALAWTACLLAVLATPALLPVLAGMVPRHAGITVRSHCRAAGQDLWLAVRQWLLQVVFLPHHAWLMADAIGRTLYRLYWSHRNLLEWTTAAQAAQADRLDLPGAYRVMGGGLVLTLLAALAVAQAGPAVAGLAAPFILAWLAAPTIAQWISRVPRAPRHLEVSAASARQLRLVARRTWRYFETFVTAEDHLLPPDNFQEDPAPVLAHRTSPTNLGLYLLAVASARDLGWIGTWEAVERLEGTLASMGRLQRFRGHFYNWYDTRDLRPLEPHYVSSVDSGNLAAHLYTLANAARDWGAGPVAMAEAATGTRDALALARQALQALPSRQRAQSSLCQQAGAHLYAPAGLLDGMVSDPDGCEAQLQDLGPRADALVDVVRALATETTAGAWGDVLFWSDATHRSIDSWRRDVGQAGEGDALLAQRLAGLAASARAMADAMQFDFLLDPQRRLLSIGYRGADGALDPSCYDLLASEARLAGFVAIAKGDVASRHWFRLGRPVTPVGHGAALVSWSGSMFEYLMPSLVMRAPAGSLLEQTSRLIVGQQVRYAAGLRIPWGISESAYNARDLELTYQYSNFGVPGLGLKRGLGADTVVAPYATALAAMVQPEQAAGNLARLAALGALGAYGYYEALDYTRTRVPEGAGFALVRAYMAHHQGMTIVAIANVLLDGSMRRRFHAEPRIQATELLLQERTPRDVAVVRAWAAPPGTNGPAEPAPAGGARCPGAADAPTPEVHLLANGRYAVMLTAAGSGYSRWRGLAVTRWREDPTRDDTGSYLFLRDEASGAVWSAGFQPRGVAADAYAVRFTEDRAEFVRRDAGITTTLEVVVSPEADAEVRCLTLANDTARARDLEITSYMELALAPPAAEAAHPAFSRLFVQTEYVARHRALLATRRQRSPGEPAIWAGHQAVLEGQAPLTPEYETDRARFLGRGREVDAPVAVMDGRHLSGTVGAVLDPVFALRYRLRVPAGGTVRLAFWTTVADSRAGLLELLDRHHDANAVERARTLAWTQAQVQLRHIGITAAEAALFQRLAGHVLFAAGSLRPAPEVLRRGAGGPGGLWSQGISGDLPVVLLRIADLEDLGLARQLLQAHEYWRMKQLAVDLVIVNERATSYLQDLQGALDALVRTSQSRGRVPGDGALGAVFVLRADLMPAGVHDLLLAVARVVLAGQRGSLAEQLDRARRPATAPAHSAPPRPPTGPSPALAPPRPDLEFDNGLGGFAANGREYVTLLGPGQSTPAPWINVVANPGFGFQVAAEGSGYTWADNSRENQLTPWSNDPVTDRPGEALYLRDDETGELWGATAAPLHAPDALHTACHGQGYSRFLHASRGVALELLMFVPLADPIKVLRLKLRNTSGRPRQLTVTAYVEWVLGLSRSASAPFVITELDPVTGALLARNPWRQAWGSRVAFADLAGRQTGWTADRHEFLGRHGTLAAPAALLGPAPLSRRLGAGLDPCAALQVTLGLAPGATDEVVLLLGEAADLAGAQALVARYRTADLAAVLQGVVDHWDQVLGTVQVQTPDRSLDLMLNRWLLYQTLACRTWARAAFYQASGAYGYRDQLQDGMALAVSRPALTRAHLLRAAGRQFAAGDVQHWWLPATGHGVRTRNADDRVWLAYATAHYIATTGDRAVLDERVPFLAGPALRPGEAEAYFQPGPGDEAGSLFEHCARALDHSLAVGTHGLPLMGTGDWNDGLNRVGELGRGESVWLGWFLHATLVACMPLARARGDMARADAWQAHAAALKAALERDGWDGGWYRRGYFDDGTPLGSAASNECRIDAIAQSWGVISGAADPVRAVMAMAAVDKMLIQRDAGLALLFTPPFDRTPLDPGYIKGYPPGIRENGGQYTHAAAWSVLAYAMLGQGDLAAGLFAMLNPVNRAASRAGVHRYKVEPYVMAADVYSVAPHVGRGGWTWYTGAAGWMYRAGLEGILGFRLHGDHLLLAPCIPAHWPGFTIAYRVRGTRYEIAVENPPGAGPGVAYVELDGRPLPPGCARIPLVDDGGTHRVRLVLGTSELSGPAVPSVN